MSGIGHNSGDDVTETSQTVAADQLRSFLERVERLEETKSEVAGDIKEVYSEAKAFGYNTKIMRKIIRMRKQDQAERQEEEAITELYLAALGMI